MRARLASFASLLAIAIGCGDPPAPLAPHAPPPARPAPAASKNVSAAEAAILASATASSGSTNAGTGMLGQITFPVTGSPDCQRLFRDGVLALHSFLYDQAHTSFDAALAADPSCAMAAWGDAMTFDHPVWHQRDLTKGRAALAKATGEDALTARERAFLAVARTLFEKDDLRQAHQAWLAAAAKMHAQFPNDDEVALQHVLALIAVFGYDPKHVREQMEAGTIALEVLERRPEHPGAAHYVIHSFDSREHAMLALRAAQTYARIAPGGGHAQHMPSHTFVHLGMWREVVPSNERAYAASIAWEKSRGHSPSMYDWHSYAWLVAAHLELGQHAKARQLVDDVRAIVVAAKDDSASVRSAYVEMVADYVTVTGRWTEVEALVAPVFTLVPEEGTGAQGPVACAAHAPGGSGDARGPYALIARLLAMKLRADASIQAGDAGAVEKRIADMKALRAQMAPWIKTLPPWFSTWYDAMAEYLGARARGGAKPSADATKKILTSLEQLVRLDAERPISGPAFLEPPTEMLGYALLGAGRPKEALVQFERDLEQRPNRAVALLGAARAAKAAGDLTTARTHYTALLDLWRDADPTLPALAEARAGASS